MTMDQLLWSVNLEQYAPLFQREELDDVNLLKSIAKTPSEMSVLLEEVGVPSAAHQRKILAAMYT